MARMGTASGRVLRAGLLALTALLTTGFKGCAVLEKEPNNTACTFFAPCEPDPNQTYYDYTGGFAGKGRVTWDTFTTDAADWWVLRPVSTATQTLTSTVTGGCVEYAMRNCEEETGGRCTRWSQIIGPLGQHCGVDQQHLVMGSFPTTQGQLVALAVLIQGFGTQADYRLELDQPGGFGATCAVGTDCESEICLNVHYLADGCPVAMYCTTVCSDTDDCIAAGGDECVPFGLANLCVSAAWLAGCP
jgi:hypothetical protein